MWQLQFINNGICTSYLQSHIKIHIDDDSPAWQAVIFHKADIAVRLMMQQSAIEPIKAVLHSLK